MFLEKTFPEMLQPSDSLKRAPALLVFCNAAIFKDNIAGDCSISRPYFLQLEKLQLSIRADLQCIREAPASQLSIVMF